jgi:hypothetical protein
MKALLHETIWEGLDSGVGTYLNLASSFFGAVDQIWEAEAASAKLLRALTEFRTSGLRLENGSAVGVLHHLARIPSGSLESLEYVTNISHLLYAATLFDTFLSNTTDFLFLLIPRAMGEHQQVPLRGLIDAPHRNEAITRAAGERTREIGNLPFAGQIEFLREAFEMEIAIPATAWEGVNHFPKVSGSTTHDHQGRFPLQLDGRGEIVMREQTCPCHPARMSRDDMRWAIDSYEQSARALTVAVFSQILKQGDHPAVQLLLKGSTANLEIRSS